MRIVLPPSETKTPGGLPGSSLDWSGLVLANTLTDTRSHIARDLVELCGDTDGAKKALGLGVTGDAWVEANREVTASPVMPAIDRYTGVVFDALDVASLSPHARERAQSTLWLFSALFGPLRATDLIPRYRLSFDSTLPGMSLKARWQPHAEAIWSGEFTVDLRSEGYRALAPLPPGCGVFVKVVKDLHGKAAVGHANKATKGRLVRDMVESGIEIATADELVAWLSSRGWDCITSPDTPDEVLLATG